MERTEPPGTRFAPMSRGELDPDVYSRICEICAQGDDLAQAERYRDAIVRYNEAWNLVPDPRHEWEVATWVLAAIADSCFLGGFLKSARDALDYVMGCPDAIGNPFLHLRRGQVLYEQGELGAAADELIRAYMGGGPEIFEGESPKYVQFLATRADI
jgi:hypothetical protein